MLESVGLVSVTLMSDHAFIYPQLTPSDYQLGVSFVSLLTRLLLPRKGHSVRVRDPLQHQLGRASFSTGLLHDVEQIEQESPIAAMAVLSSTRTNTSFENKPYAICASAFGSSFARRSSTACPFRSHTFG